MPGFRLGTSPKRYQPRHRLRHVRLQHGLLLASCALASCNGDAGPGTGTSIHFTAIQAGARHTCALAEGGVAYCWGDKFVDQVGDGVSDRLTNGIAAPVKVVGGRAFLHLSAGDSHTCGIDANGAAFCWGDNSKYALGSGEPPVTLATAPAPIAVVGGVAFTSLAAGGFQTCGLTAVGVAYCWGANTYGEVGNGDVPPQYYPEVAPTPVVGELRYDALAAGGYSTCGLIAGVLTCWGRGYGSSPVVVDTDHQYVAVELGDQHGCALTDDGTAYCWGRGTEGQLGAGDALDREVPTAVGGGLHFGHISAGGTHTCALSLLGEAYCWGRNDSGQLGTGAAADETTPAKVATDLAFVAIAAGLAHTCALTSEGAAYCWGSNTVSQLGNGIAASGHSLVPVPVVSPDP